MTKQAEKVKPVGRFYITGTDTYPEIEVEVMNGETLQPEMSPVYFYTAPPRKPWVGLTGEELAQLTIDNAGYPTRLTAAIEAKLKERNT